MPYNKPYNERKNPTIMTISVTKDIIKTLDLLKHIKIIKSRSEAVRQMIYYAFPYFLGLHKLMRLIASEKYKLTKFKPKKTELKDLQPNTLKQLRKLYPETIDYKFINEE